MLRAFVERNRHRAASCPWSSFLGSRPELSVAVRSREVAKHEDRARGSRGLR